MNDDKLRRAYRETLAAQPAGSECPTGEQLERLARREGAAADLVVGLDHVMSCPRCLPAFELLRSVHAASRAEAAPARRVPRGVWLAAAVVVLAAGVVTLMPRFRSGPGGDQVRGGDASVRLVSPAEAGSAGPPVRLVWRPVADVDRYDVEVLDSLDAVVAAGATVDTAWTVDADLATGSSYRWRVTAVTLSGRTVGSEIRTFSIPAR